MTENVDMKAVEMDQKSCADTTDVFDECSKEEKKLLQENESAEEDIMSENGTVSETARDVQINSEPDTLGEIAQMRESMAEQGTATAKVLSEIKEIHKLYHNEFAGRLRNMQEELEKYHEIDRGRVHDDILREIARIYCDNEALLNIQAEDKVKKHIKYLFMDIEQLLESNGIKMQKSSPGDKRNNKFCQIVDRIETSDPEKHDTVACSKGTGFFTDKRPLIKELIDVYLYQPIKGNDITETERS